MTQAQEVRYDATLNHRTSSGSATPVGSKQPTGATQRLENYGNFLQGHNFQMGLERLLMHFLLDMLQSGRPNPCHFLHF